MTGTSLDGLDVVLTHVTGSGLDMRVQLIAMVSRPLDDLRDSLLHLASGGAGTPIDYMRAARGLGELHADAVAELCDQHLPGGASLGFVAAHGQTIRHAPREHMSWQLFDPWPIVRRMKVPVCYDLRQADLIANGEGAPITPIADWVLFRERANLIVNLGGICNVTYWKNPATNPRNIEGVDLCPCNLLIDGLVRRLFSPRTIDNNGEISAQGKFSERIFRLFKAAAPIQGPGEPSLGREQYDDRWFDMIIEQAGSSCARHDLLRGAVEFVIAAVDECSKSFTADAVVLAGGGARNLTLVEGIRSRNLETEKVQLSDGVGIPCEAREAVCFAVLGALSQDGVTITLPQVTCSEKPGIAGAWAYP